MLRHRERHHRAQKDLGRTETLKQTRYILMVDVDHLKQTNNQYGHAAGNVLLKRAARISEHLQKTRNTGRICPLQILERIGQNS